MRNDSVTREANSDYDKGWERAYGKKRKVVYVIHKYTDDPIRNKAIIARIARSLIEQDIHPLLPQMYFDRILDETNQELALSHCQDLIRLADECYWYGPTSPGCEADAKFADSIGTKVSIKTYPWEQPYDV